MVDLSASQLDVVDRCRRFLMGDGGQIFRVGGYAGTGKTTVLRSVVGGVAPVVAFMGKAADVLRKKGLPGQTIHSLIYKWDDSDKRFYKVDKLAGVDWICVDEGSLVGSLLWSDLLSYNKKIIVFGDPAQLEPVGDDDPHLMRNPDVCLTEIHRTGNDSLLDLATSIREGSWEGDWGVVGRPAVGIGEDDLLETDIWLCGFNKTRVRMNTAVRRVRGFTGPFAVGDRLKCTVNDRELGVFNGSMMTVLGFVGAERGNLRRCVVEFDGGEVAELTLTVAGLGAESKLSWDTCKRYAGKVCIVDYGYCITVHSSQGSEWDRVSVIDEQCRFWCPNRWRYTAVTRACSDLRVFS